MAVRFNLYYLSEENRAYLEGVVKDSRQGVVVHSEPLKGVLPEISNYDTDVALVEYDSALEGLDQWIEHIKHQEHHPAIYLHLHEADTETLLKALRLGVQECFVQEISPEDFDRALQRLLKAKKMLKPGEKTQIIAVFGCKGGAGVTFVAVNLAQSLYSSLKEPVLLCDLDLRASNVTSFLDMSPKYTIVDLVENFAKIDPQYLKDIIYHLDSGLEVLPGPTRLEDSELLQPQQLEDILTYVRSQNLYRWLVLDLGDFLDEFTIRALELADQVLLVTLLTIPGLRDAQKVLDTLKLLDFNPEKILPVVNSYSKNADIQLSEGEKFLGREFFSVLRFDHEAVVRSINEGRPLVETQPRHRLSGDFSSLVLKLQHDGGENGHRPGFLGTLKRLLHLGDNS